MAVHLVDGIERLVELGMQDIVQDEIVPYAKREAPHDTGRLRASIHAIQTGRFDWIVTTNARGDNGVEYPARIEKGQAVYPTKAKALWYHKRWHSMARASYQSHFMENTVNRFK